MHDSAVYDLSSKPRRYPGLTKVNPYKSLHGRSLQARAEPKESPLDNITAPPESSCEEESEAEEDPRTIVVSDNSPQKASKSKQPIARKLREGAQSCSPKKKVATSYIEHDKDPADVPHTAFVHENKLQSLNGSQESQKRRKEMLDMEDEQIDMWGSQNKRVKPNRAYGKSSQQGNVLNIHLEPTKQSKDPIMGSAASIKVSENGFKSILSAEDSPRSQRASQRSSGSTQASSQSTPKKSFKMPPKVSMQGSSLSTSKKEFKMPPVASKQDSSQTTPKKGFRKPSKVSPKDRAPDYKILQLSNDRRNTGKTTRSLTSANESSVFAQPNPIVATAVRDAVNISKDKLGISDTQLRSLPPSTGTSSLTSTSLDDNCLSSPLSSPPLEFFEISPTRKNVEYVTNAAIALAKEDSSSRCPLCKEKVEGSFLEEWAGGRRLTIRQQADFCKAYKKHTAQNEWRKQGFPEIQWQSLDERLNQYHNAIDDVLQGRKISFYRNAFEDLVKVRKDRTLRKSLMDGDEFEESIPGYYGSRGARIMYGYFSRL